MQLRMKRFCVLHGRRVSPGQEIEVEEGLATLLLNEGSAAPVRPTQGGGEVETADRRAQSALSPAASSGGNAARPVDRERSRKKSK